MALRLVLQQLRRGRLHLLLLHLPQRGNSRPPTFLLFFPRPEDGGRQGGQKGQGAETSSESLFRRRLLLGKKTSSFRGKLTQSNFPAKKERKITVTHTTRATGEQQQVPQVVVGGRGGGQKNKSDPEAERPATREPCAKNKLIRVAECISYLMRANYGESRWLVRVCVCVCVGGAWRRFSGWWWWWRWGGASYFPSASESKDVELLCRRDIHY